MTTLMLEDEHPTEALKHNGSESLVPGSSMPVSTAPLYAVDLAEMTMQQLDQMVATEHNVLTIISRAGQAVLRDRLMAIFTEMARRFEAGESFRGFTGNKGMGAYLRSIGLNPGKLRVWKFQLRREQTAPPNPAKAKTGGGDDAAIAISGGEVSEVAELNGVARTPVMVEGLNDHVLSVAELGAADLEAVLDRLKSCCLATFSDAFVQNVTSMLGNQILISGHAERVEQLADLLRGIADNAHNLAVAIAAALET